MPREKRIVDEGVAAAAGGVASVAFFA